MVGKIIESMFLAIKMWYSVGFELVGSGQLITTAFGITIITALTGLITSIILSTIRTFIR